MGEGRSDSDRLASLDGLRGVAALAVVFYHMQDGIGLAPCPHGYLAVDVFFVLSGYVLARRFGPAVSGGTLGSVAFLRARFVRVLPMAWLGSLTGFVLATVCVATGLESVNPGDLLAALPLALAMLPTLWTTSLGYDAYPLDGPLWSLFSELLANALWPLLARRPDAKRLCAVVMTIGAAGTVYGCLLFGEASFGASPGSFGLGLARVAWGFPAGLLLASLRRPLPKLPWFWPTAGLVALLCCPLWREGNGLWDAGCVLIAAPAIVAGSIEARIGKRVARCAGVAGRLSYPLYAVHAPFVHITGAVLQRVPQDPAFRGVATIVCLCVSLGAAWLATGWIEGAVRRLASRLARTIGHWRGRARNQALRVDTPSA